MTYNILVASYTNEIYTLSFDPKLTSLTVVTSVVTGHQPSWVTSYPGDPSLVFAALEQPEGKIILVKYDNDGNGDILGEVPSGGADPCSLLATRDELFVANYSSGTVSTFPISSKAPYLLSTAPTTTQLFGSGPDTLRQQTSHTHQVSLLEEYHELLVPDLGADKVHRFKKDDDGLWKLRGHTQCQAGSGPRHVAFYDGFLYILLELTSSLTKYRFPPLPNEPSFVTAVSTMSQPPQSQHNMLAAEILIPTPNATYPIPYIYVSNRNDPSSGGDTIAIFSIANPDTLDLIAEVRTGLKSIRGMAFGGPDDRWLIAGGVSSGGVKIFERVDGGKNLTVIVANEGVTAPAGFLWV